MSTAATVIMICLGSVLILAAILTMRRPDFMAEIANRPCGPMNAKACVGCNMKTRRNKAVMRNDSTGQFRNSVGRRKAARRAIKPVLALLYVSDGMTQDERECLAFPMFPDSPKGDCTRGAKT